MSDITEPVTFDFGDMIGYEHRIGDLGCDQGWCGSGYPKACEDPACSGLVHANFGDENADGDYWLYTNCDVCGESE
jgi:hypothetical protein